ncbi:MAG: response regulator [Bacteroidota bacterium]
MEDLTILVAEDEDYNYELLHVLLSKKTKRLLHAKNGAEVLALLENQKPDLILMDLKMPVMNGYEATRKARSMFPDLRIIALTAYTQPEEERLAIEAGCCAFISKPIKKQDLIETIRRSLRN